MGCVLILGAERGSVTLGGVGNFYASKMPGTENVQAMKVVEKFRETLCVTGGRELCCIR
jgi:hypothetical protein